MEVETHEMAWCSLDYKCLLEITGMVSRMASAPSTSSSQWTHFILTTSKASPHKNFWWMIITTVQLNSYSEGWQIPSSCHWEANSCPGVCSGGPESSVCVCVARQWREDLGLMNWVRYNEEWEKGASKDTQLVRPQQQTDPLSVC